MNFLNCFSNLCICGNEKPKPQLAVQSVARECNRICPGDPKYNCGGTSKIIVYRTGILFGKNIFYSYFFKTL